MCSEQVLPPLDGGGIQFVAGSGTIAHDFRAVRFHHLRDLVKEPGSVEEDLALGRANDIRMRPCALREGVACTGRMLLFALHLRRGDGARLMLKEFNEQGFSGGVGRIMGTLGELE